MFRFHLSRLWTMLCVLACAGAIVAAARTDGDLLAHYTFDEVQEQSRPHGQVADHSPMGHNGTLYGATYVKMEKGYARA